MRQSLRFAVFSRDGFRCRYCGRSAEHDGVKLNADHVHPKSLGGSTTLDNLVTACWDCNIGKGAKVIRPLRPVYQRRPSRPMYKAAPAERLLWEVGSHCSTPLKVAAMTYYYGWATYRQGWTNLERMSRSSPMFGVVPPCRASDYPWLEVVKRDPSFCDPLVASLERAA